MNVALVHEHLGQDGGAERVVRIFQKMFPSAPLYTLVYNPDRAHPGFRGTDIRTSFIQRLPGGVKHYQWYLRYMPTAIERFDLSEYDVVISSASGFAKGVITNPETLHLCYLHSPTRYLWDGTHQYIRDLPYPNWMKQLLPSVLTNIRMWDRLAADRVDDYVVNSKLVARRLEKFYRRTGTIIYPPVETQRFTIQPKTDKYYLTGGRLVPYKRFDLAINAFNRLGLPLKVFGTGPALKHLQEIAGPTIEFLGRVPDAAMNELYGRAAAFINPQVEDFGITVVEAMATGRPVIAFAAGGALETVKAGESGNFFMDQEWESLADAVIRFKPEEYEPTRIRAWAETFSVDRFINTFRQHVDQAWQAHQSRIH
ncbi:MAG: glycosyltransferase [Candidatus Kerfeldbacteria bacterium]|nr:glycosyltransferase [Candidatus Kerfeldbacteria bacterium]